VTSTLAVMHRYVENQGDCGTPPSSTSTGWSPRNRPSRGTPTECRDFPAMRMELLGRRVQSCTARSRSAPAMRHSIRAGLAA